MAKNELKVNGDAVIKARKELGFYSRPTFLEHLQKLNMQISIDTLERYERSTPDKPHYAQASTITILADVLKCPMKSLILDNDEINGKPIRQRNCAGTWLVQGGDIVVPKHFEYPNGPKPLKAEVKITVDGTAVDAIGKDHDGDVVRLKGRLEEGGDHIIGTYEVLNDRMRIYGTVNLQYLACGKKMKGWYLGRETGQGLPYILGHLELTLVKE